MERTVLLTSDNIRQLARQWISMQKTFPVIQIAGLFCVGTSQVFLLISVQKLFIINFYHNLIKPSEMAKYKRIVIKLIFLILLQHKEKKIKA